MTTTDPFTEAASVAANERFGTAGNREVWMEAAAWARAHLSEQEPSMTSEFTPSERQVRRSYIDGVHPPLHIDAAAEFDRFLARVRRDAKAEAWDEACEAFAWCITNGPIEDALPYVAEHNPHRATEYESGDQR